MRYHVTRDELERRDAAQTFSAGGRLYAFQGGRYGLDAISLFLSETLPGSGPRWHTHPYEEVVALHEGQGTYYVGDATVQAHAGDVVVIPAGLPHTFINSGTGPLRHTAVHANQEIVTVFVEAKPAPSGDSKVGGTGTERAMSAETNKAIIRRYLEEWANRGDEAVVKEVIADEWVSYGTQSASASSAILPRGLAGARQLHHEVRAIWPDNQWTIEDMVAEGDRVAVRMTNRATHCGTYRGIPATGKRVVFSSIWIYRLRDGKIVEAWRSADDLGRVVQIGGTILPPTDG